METLLFSVLYGFYAGAVYLILLFIRELFNKNIVLTILLDLAWGISAGLLFGICIFKVNNGIIRLYEVIAFIIGIILILLTLKNLVAQAGNFLYNKVIKKINAKITKLLKRGVTRGHKQNNQNS